MPGFPAQGGFGGVLFTGLLFLLWATIAACGPTASLPGENDNLNVGRDARPDIFAPADAGIPRDAQADAGGTCGNGIQEAGEECDDGNTFPGDGCDANCRVETETALAFRVDWMVLRDPHIFVDVFGTCYDVTDEGPEGKLSVNEQMSVSIQEDGDNDGYLNLNLVIVMNPYSDSPSHNGPATIYSALCTAPMSGTVCREDPASPGQSTTVTNQGAGTCLSPYPGTTSAYTPPVMATTAPPTCFHTESVDLSLLLGGVDVVLHHAEVAAVYENGQAFGLISGLIRGFISEQDAENIPVDLGLLGTMPLSDLLAPNGCGGGDDLDTDVAVEGSVRGWWFYLNFTATPVDWTGP